MKIDDLMQTLAEIRKEKGNLDVQVHANLDYDNMIVDITDVQVKNFFNDEPEKLIIVAEWDFWEEDDSEYCDDNYDAKKGD